MDGPGTVTWEEFLENAQQFLVVSDKISDGWKFHGNKVHPVLHRNVPTMCEIFYFARESLYTRNVYISKNK